MTSGSNTGLKGISAKHYEGAIIGFNVTSQWRLHKLYEWIPVQGTVHDALQKAIQTRAEFYHQQRKPNTENYIIGTTTGVILNPRDKVWGAPTYTAYIQVDGEKFATDFSTRKHGKRGAYLLALAWRKEKEIELHGQAFT